MSQPAAGKTVVLETPSGGEIRMGRGRPLFLLAGPCVVEGREKTLTIARILKEICGELGVPLVFKASYDKANRTSHASFHRAARRTPLRPIVPQTGWSVLRLTRRAGWARSGRDRAP
jgi:3-deoxy-D-arabino-heptulosonate 7-phosphate (DAHP) synthase